MYVFWMNFLSLLMLYSHLQIHVARVSKYFKYFVLLLLFFAQGKPQTLSVEKKDDLLLTVISIVSYYN